MNSSDLNLSCICYFVLVWIQLQSLRDVREEHEHSPSPDLMDVPDTSTAMRYAFSTWTW